MGNLRSSRRRLNEHSVQISKAIDRKKQEFAKKFIQERIGKDAEFAQDVLNAVGSNLPEEFKKLAEETIARESSKKEAEIVRI